MAGAGNRRTDIVFASLPACLDFLARIFRKFGHHVFYLDLASPGQFIETERRRAVALRGAGIVPLPLEFLPHMDGILESYNDPDNKSQIRAGQLAPVTLLRAFEALYPNNADAVDKLRVAVQSMNAGQVATVGRMNCWARAHPDRRNVLIYPGGGGLLAFGLASNVGLLLMPIGALSKGVALLAQVFRRFSKVVASTKARKASPAVAAPPDSPHASVSRAVFVTHAGLSYGKLFEKTLFYSARADSELHPDNLLHLDYCGVPGPSAKIKWVCLGEERQSFWTWLRHALFAMGRGIVRVRSLPQIIGLLLLSRFYADFVSYSKKLEAYPDLTVALIDYEILCPMALLFAFDARNIRTVAVQERFSGAFSATKGGAVLNTYLCGSEYVAGIMKKSSAYYADHYVPVGQYRCDNLVAARHSPPPQILQTPIAEGRKIVTALGFHTHMEWYNSQCDPLLNWSAHRQFLEDMIRLASDIPHIFIILRFKMVNWVSLPVFAEVVREIEASENMTISMDYEKSFFSYDLCAHSDLVIARHTSLGDECLAVGIPVLFHEYTHNTERLVADAFDYSPARIMCFNYRELVERARAILGGDLGTMATDLEYLKNVVFGGLGDGKVRERIHGHIESLLKEHF